MIGNFKEKLELALDLRQLSAAAAGRLTGVHANTILAYLSDENTSQPSAATIDKLANGLKLHPAFFYNNLPEKPKHLFFRSLEKTKKSARKAAVVRTRLVAKFISILENLVTLPELNLPEYGDLPSFNNLSYDDIEEIAVKLRDHWGLGIKPIINLTWHMENNGISIVYGKWYDDYVDAFSGWFTCANRVIVMLPDNDVMPSRNRFTLAHELGHLILHGELQSFNCLDSPNIDIRLIENQANVFASAFLLPKASFGNEVRPEMGLKDLLHCKARWHTSCRAMIHRMHHLEIIDSKRAQLLYKMANARWGAQKEPLEIPFESPYLVKESLMMLRDSDIVQIDEWCSNCGIHQQELLDFLGCYDLSFSNPAQILEIHSGHRTDADVQSF